MKSSWPRQGRPVKRTGSRFATLLSIAVAVVATGVLCAAPSAMAARVSVSGSTLFVKPTASERNVITIAKDGDVVTVRDGGAPPQADLPCTADGDTVSCDAAGIARLSVNLGSLDDELTITAPIPAILIAGGNTDAGNDTIQIRNGVADRNVDCGQGTDTAIIDPGDAVTNCESVDDGVPPDTAIDSAPPAVFNQVVVPANFEFSARNEPAAKFRCRIDSQVFDDCTSPFTASLLPEGEHTFGVAAADSFGNTDPTEATATFVVDETPPNTTITSGPPDITDTRTPTFVIGASEPGVTFECQVDNGDVGVCQSPFTLSPLENGTHSFHVWARDAAGNADQTGAARNFIVAASSVPPPKIQQPFVIVLGSIVLISGRTVKMSKSGTVPVSLNCAGSQVCKGKLTLTTADPVRITARKIARLGNAKFKIKPQGKKLIRVRLSKTARKLVKRLRRVRSRATIREVDLRGNPRISSRLFTLRSK